MQDRDGPSHGWITMDLLALSDFNAVAAHGGFGRASRATGRPKATLSRRIRELEEALAVRLIERGGRSLRLTEEGAALHARTERLLAEIAEAGAAASAASGRLRGRLRISAPVLFAHAAMGRIAAGFVAAHPDVEVEVIAEDRHVDLVEEGYDLAIRINPGPDTGLVGRRFLRDELVAVAPPTLARPPPPAAPDAVAAVPAVVLAGYGREDAEWRVRDGADERRLRLRPVLRLSSLMMVRDAALAGAGMALLPPSLVSADIGAGRLVRWGSVPDRSVELWAMHASRRLVSGKVSAFVRFLAAAFPDGTLAPPERNAYAPRVDAGSAPATPSK